MQTSPYEDVARVAALERELHKTAVANHGAKSAQIDYHFRVAARLGYSVPDGARVLDFGCGAGDSVSILLSRGYDAYGVDTLELWGRDFDKLWEKRDLPTGPHLSRLYVVNGNAYRLPFPAGSFDFAFSDQVFEHVFNYEQVFRELARVLKPNAISVHEFP